MAYQTFKDWLSRGVPCTFLAGILGSFPCIHEGVCSGIDDVMEEIVPRILEQYESVRMLDALTGELLYGSDELPF